jgi:RNA polymerase sigma-70 factor (ECF subfamily)
MNAQDTPAESGGSDPAEAQAIARLKHADLSGLEFLVQRYQVKAVHIAVLILHDRDLAEETVQNCFYQVALKIDQFDARRPFGPWFFKSVANAAVQEATRQKKRVSLDDDDMADAGEAAEWLVDPAGCPEDLVETEALYRAIWRALDQLPPNQRAAIVMRYFQGSSEAEITQAFQRPQTTIKWWLHAARERLRRIIQPEALSDIEDREVPHE